MLRHWSLREVLGSLMLVLATAAAPETAAEVVRQVSVKPETSVELDRGKCIVQLIKSQGGVVSTDPDGTMYLHYTAPAGQFGQVTILAQVGAALEAGACKPAIERRYVVNIDSKPIIPQSALGEAFRILVAAFVLAVLLESAFELLFNWRLFQEYFVGKAWRTPIMFAVTLLVVRQFGFDPLAQVFNAYQGGGAHGKDDWLTAIISAMILAGGSVGVNRIMTSLGIRSPFPKAEQELARLNDREAYLSVTVRAKAGSERYAVNMSDMPAASDTPQVLGIIGANREGRLRNLFFPTSLRVPRSGGTRVSVDKSYRISVTDLRTGDVYDIFGKPSSATAAPPLRFAPRAFVDIVIILD
ncbi:hypothetical protein [Janthinobacterium sp. MDT1-19]|uniref:hypothetical protein n=1 Tax=Janthinobacterium sp. MDT1-19 TaxID=1259339 RepID=UPI003F27DC7B